MDRRVRFSRAPRPRGDEVLEFFTFGRSEFVRGYSRVFFTHFLGRAVLFLGGDLVRLAGAQQGRHLVGVEQAGDAEVFLLFLGAHLGTRTPRGTVE